MTKPSIEDRATTFAALHERDRLFVLPNPWDVGSAKLLAALGFEALATTSAGYAFSRGKIDWVGETSRDEALAHAQEIVSATNLPVSADFENGFGEAPEKVAETVRYAGEIGLAGCTIEDTSGVRDKPIYDRTLAVERIEAAVAAARNLGRPFMLTARAENFLHGRQDLDDTLARLKAFEACGADVLYAPGLPDLPAIKTVCGALTKPVNVVAGIGLDGITIEDLQHAGVKRVSLGSSLARTAIGALLRAARTLAEDGSFEDLKGAASFAEIEQLLRVAGKA